MEIRHNPVGIYEKALPPFRDWFEALEITRQCGYDFLELSIDESDERLDRLHWTKQQIVELRSAVAKTSVPVRHLCLSGHRRFPVASDDTATRERGWDMMKRAIDLCGELGVRIIQTQGHDVYYEESTEGTWNRYMDAMAQAAEMARGASVMIGLENADLPQIGSLDQARAFIDRIGNPWFQMYPDIGNVVAHGYEIVPQLQKAIGQIVAVHIKDARPGEFRRVGFGAGIVPFSNAFRALEASGYRGPFVIEMWNDSIEDPHGVIRDALTWVRDRMNVGQMG